jgi:hypothetical protein
MEDEGLIAVKAPSPVKWVRHGPTSPFKRGRESDTWWHRTKDDDVSIVIDAQTVKFVRQSFDTSPIDQQPPHLSQVSGCRIL